MPAIFVDLTAKMSVALGWLEYCNSEQDTYYANLRRKNGREKPYNVKYWALGNEVWGPWQVEQVCISTFQSNPPIAYDASLYVKLYPG